MRARKSNIKVPNGVGQPPKWPTILEEFMASNSGVYELIPDAGEYSSYKTLQSCACTAINKMGLPISTYAKDGKVYLVKRRRGEDR